MRKTFVVPIDFTHVSHEALIYACELSVNLDVEILAVHLLDATILNQFKMNEDPQLRKMAEKMYIEVMQKTKNDLDNFLEGLSYFYGDIIRPIIAHGTIYEAFNDVAAKYDSPLIIMGTHGITGVQQIVGSRAYRVVVNTPYPFLIVQGKSFQVIAKIVVFFKNAAQINNHVKDINIFAGVIPGKFVFNIISGHTITLEDLPAELRHLGHRITLDFTPLNGENVIERTKGLGGDAIGIHIDEADNINEEAYGIKQDRILENKYKFPVLCLPRKI